MPREDAYTCLQNSYISLDVEVVKNDDTRYVDEDQMALVNFGPVASFSEAKLTTSSGKNLGKVDKLHTISILHKLFTSKQQTSELLFGFEESVAIRRLELTNSKTEKGTFFVKNRPTDLFGFSDQEKRNILLGQYFTLERNKNNDPNKSDNGVDAAKLLIQNIRWFIPHSTPSLKTNNLLWMSYIKKIQLICIT